MIKTELISTKYVELNPVNKVCPLCGKFSKHRVIWIYRPKKELENCIRAEYCYEDYMNRKVSVVEYKNRHLGHVFISNGDEEFLGFLCSSCKLLYRPSIYEESGIARLEKWGIYFRGNRGFERFTKQIKIKMAIGVICDNRKQETPVFYNETSKTKTRQICYNNP